MTTALEFDLKACDLRGKGDLIDLAVSLGATPTSQVIFHTILWDKFIFPDGSEIYITANGGVYSYGDDLEESSLFIKEN